MIVLDSVTKIYPLPKQPSVTAVREVSLEIRSGEFVVITGRSGSGKTTLLNLASGLTQPTSGRVLWEGLDLWTLNDLRRSRMRNQRIGFVFQFPSLLPTLTVLQNVTLPTVFSASGAQRGNHERACELLETVGLASKINVYPRQLSAGQQQRVVVARALFNQPELLLADEPTSDLDEKTEHEIMELFAEIHHRSGITIVMVTHTTQLVRYGTRSLRMAGGRIAEVGLDQETPA